ncbi:MULTISPECIES: hypothetical protein [unclassified Novosphingobium]|uniref:hypothetical protein n=1 Tax=unclassified Novosphingobium TaxID=2644732 RepID=UPI0013572D01|nr:MULTISPECIES: hypothetical protein [unclassified Novosphingobium]
MRDPYPMQFPYVGLLNPARDAQDFVQGHDLNIIAGIKNLRHHSIIYIDASVSSCNSPALHGVGCG